MLLDYDFILTAYVGFDGRYPACIIPACNVEQILIKRNPALPVKESFPVRSEVIALLKVDLV